MREEGKISSTLVRLKFSALMAFDGISSNLLRTFLTVLGISIGVAAVISLMGIGEGARRSIVSQFESLGENVIVIKSNSKDIIFTKEESDELSSRVTGIEYSTPVIYAKDVIVRWRRDESKMNIIGVNQDFVNIKDHKVVSGNFFTSLHVKNRSSVAVLGYNIGASLLNGRSPVGQAIKIDGINYSIVGVLEKKGEGKGDGIDDKIVIPYSSILRITKTDEISEIWAKSKSSDDAELAMVQLGRIYKRKTGTIKNIAPENSSTKPEVNMPSLEVNTTEEMPIDKEEESVLDNNVLKKQDELITVTSLNNLVEEADKANRIMTILLGGIAAVSLLVGGIGIMNIMLVAVTERTSEIGVRRALGAKKEDLLIQFLIEALYVSVIGSVVGILIGYWATKIVSGYGLYAVVNFESIRISVFVALSSGLLFGVYPAINASSLQPVDALKSQ